MLTVGSLFSGIGGFDLGLERAGYEIKWQVENNDYCRRVLQKHWSSVPCHYDITTIDWHWIPRVDLVCGGFPCQPFSCAGKQRGAADDRYLWPEVVRCLDTLRPAWFLGENVPGLLHLGIEQVLSDLEALGYQTQILGIPACGVDAPHIRQRLWIVAHSECQQFRDARCGKISGTARTLQANEKERQWLRSDARNGSKDVADADGNQQWRRASSQQIRRQRGTEENGTTGQQGRTKWPVEPAVGRVADGVPHRVDRLKGLGNAVVPHIVEALGRMILQAHQEVVVP